MNDQIPSDLRYTKDHEWARRDADGLVTVGITAFAVDALGDITVVTLPRLGTEVEAGKHFGDVDSVKTVSELFAPISGTVVGVNERLQDAPELVNTSCYGEGWMVTIRPADIGALDGLLSAEQYAEHLKNV